MRLLGTQVVVLLVLALPAAASANDFQNVYREYKRTGTIRPCHFSNKQLSNAEKQTPPDVEQYAPSFLDALQSARERGADCHKKTAVAAPAPAPTTPSSAAAPTPSTPTPAPPPTATAPAATPAPAAAPPAPTVPAQPAVAGVRSPPISHPKQDGGAPLAVWLLAALAALIVLSAVFAGLAWWFGWSGDPFGRGWRASWDDFGGQLSDAGIEFRDWLRTGF